MKGLRKKLIEVALHLDDIKTAGYKVPMGADHVLKT
jgi:hypothetical protein